MQPGLGAAPGLSRDSSIWEPAPSLAWLGPNQQKPPGAEASALAGSSAGLGSTFNYPVLAGTAATAALGALLSAPAALRGL